MEAYEILEQAAQAIVDHGHAKGVLRDDLGRMCIFGAMQYVIGDAKGVLGPAVTMLGCALGGGTIRVVDWNNAPETTAEQVVAKMREVAADLRAKLAIERARVVAPDAVTGGRVLSGEWLVA